MNIDQPQGVQLEAISELNSHGLCLTEMIRAREPRSSSDML